MTRITRLSLQGFKSFRKRVSIPFFPGLIVIAGPNGSGKTNILDAICFALGRSSIKSLRAERLHDLIYHGNKKFPPADYASVTMWFDNSQKIFPFEENEISITRKVNKAGMSLFKINGKTTTREKILEVLSAARIHPDGFNIIMQGDVNQVIEMTPEERRFIIDDISGISQYNDKKEKAKANLDKVEQKLREVEIVISERMQRLVELEHDRNIALRYKDLQKNLEVLKASLAHQKYVYLLNDYKKTDTEVSDVDVEIRQIEDEIKRIEKDLELAEKRKEEIANKMFVRSKDSSIRSEIEELRTRIARNETRIDSNIREMDRINSMIQKLDAIKLERRGFSRGVQAILDLNRKGVYGVISNLIQVPSEYEIAVEVAGGQRLQNIVVEDTLVATECINYLKREKIGRATFLPLNKIKSKKLSPEQRQLLKKPGVIGLITDVIDFDRKFISAIEHVFGDTIIVENLGVARDIGIGSIRMVTLDGDLIETSGAMIGGFYEKKELLGPEKEISEYMQAKKDLAEEINFLRVEIDQINKKIDELKSIEEKENKEISGLDEERIKIDQDIEELKDKRKELYEQRIVLQNKINRTKIKAAKLEAELDNLKLEAERYGDVDFIDEKPEILEMRIQDQTRELNSLGLVNLKAIEEYDAYKIEFDELKAKYDKINEEKQSILEMIEKIEEKRKQVFYETLAGVSENFQKVFKEITGGDASLDLEDPLNIESGLIIRANPTGKAILNIDAMSGGEKSVTALAFLFAVQMYKPAPFYILDEIDAFLDKINTKKIIDMIKKLSSKDQFIVISHNDYTVKQADKVYGVAMEDGESKILGLEMPNASEDE
ncbi:MAG: AAA family ATPase [Candidatus Aenigmarchaeota archaeon]|nr:AAA family ATPase [Candidatus Aenigmarchaeota archaeon]